MRTFVHMALVITMAAAGVPSSLAATPQDECSLRGTAYRTDLQPVPNTRVQVRNLVTADAVASTSSGQSGEFSFEHLRPGSYVVEIVDGTGRITGMSAPFSLVSGMAATVSVVVIGQGAVRSGGGAGFSLLGMGPTATLAVLGAAGAAGVTAVVATRQDASPSR